MYQRRRAWGSTTLPLLRYPASMPRPQSGRQALEQGRAELPGQIASSQRELDARPPQNKARRERLGWQVENLARGLAYVRERLGALRTEG